MIKIIKKLIIIGAAVGAAAAIAIIIFVVLWVLRKKRLNMVDDEANVVPETNSSVTVYNNLNNMMKNDDPFAADFNIELEDMKHDEKWFNQLKSINHKNKNNFLIYLVINDLLLEKH